MEALIPDPLIHLAELDLVALSALLIQPENQNELPRRGGGGLDLVQMGGVLPQQFPQGGQFLLLQPLAVPLLIALKGLPGVQGQDTQLRHGAQQMGQSCHPAPDPL